MARGLSDVLGCHRVSDGKVLRPTVSGNSVDRRFQITIGAGPSIAVAPKRNSSMSNHQDMQLNCNMLKLSVGFEHSHRYKFKSRWQVHFRNGISLVRDSWNLHLCGLVRLVDFYHLAPNHICSLRLTQSRANKPLRLSVTQQLYQRRHTIVLALVAECSSCPHQHMQCARSKPSSSKNLQNAECVRQSPIT